MMLPFVPMLTMDNLQDPYTDTVETSQSGARLVSEP